MISIAGNYYLKLIVGGQEVSISRDHLQELVIVQDWNSVLPTFRLNMKDPAGEMVHIMPLDMGGAITIEFGYPPGGDTGTTQISDANATFNSFDFVATNRTPISEFGTSGQFVTTGMLDIPALFTPDHSRAFHGSVIDNLRSMAADLPFMRFSISPELGYALTMVQPHVSNMEFLTYHRDNLGAYHAFIGVQGGHNYFTFRSTKDFVSQAPRLFLMVGDQPFGKFLPVYRYEICDNYRLLGAFTGQMQERSYYDYLNGKYVETTQDIQGFPSLTPWFAVHTTDQVYGNHIETTGRSCDFSSDWSGKSTNIYYDKLVNLSKIWVATQGLPNILPGDVVDLTFSQAVESGMFDNYQYSGFWLVERCVHTITDGFRTRLLLTRNGIDGTNPKSLVRATNPKTS